MATSKKVHQPVKKDFYAAIKDGLKLPDGVKVKRPGKPKKSFRSVRRADYRGHSIRIETTYRISVDGEPFTRHVNVSQDGSVQCHDLPNYSFSSAMDMMRKVVGAEAEFVPPVDEVGAKPGAGKSRKKKGKKG